MMVLFMPHIRIDGVSKSFGTARALDNVTLDLAAGSFTAFLGASGCGKTTLLRLIAGFERPDAGTIRFDDTIVSDHSRLLAPEERNIGIVFQSYALWPHLSVGGNVAYPLKVRGLPRGAIDEKVATTLASVGLAHLADRMPDELSGGQRQRVALARCLVANAQVILFDEPLANLDIHLRETMIATFREIHRLTRTTIVYVTHDQTEALALADRVAVMDGGKLLQLADPERLYAAPRHPTVAGFIGRGRMIDCVVEPLSETAAVVTCGGATFPARADHPSVGAGSVLLRPDRLRVAGAGLAGGVQKSTYRGPVHELEIETAGGNIILDHPHAIAPGTPVQIAVDDAWLLPQH